jgi:isoleucyl-tRNA synthetase
MLALDRWALSRTRELQHEVVAAYRSYDFHVIYQKLHNFCVVDLGGFYLDVLKDRLYTTPAGGLPRRSAQTAMYWIAEAMVRWLAPIMSFTAEEIWRFMPGQRAESVFFTTWADIPATTGIVQEIDWPKVLEARATVLREPARLRVAEQIGAPLDAEVTLYGTPAWIAALKPLGDELRFVLITSEARVADAEARPPAALATDGEGKSGLWLDVRRSESPKCARCWHKRPDVGTVSAHPELCGRCAVNLEGAGESRRYA